VHERPPTCAVTGPGPIADASPRPPAAMTLRDIPECRPSAGPRSAPTTRRGSAQPEPPRYSAKTSGIPSLSHPHAGSRVRLHPKDVEPTQLRGETSVAESGRAQCAKAVANRTCCFELFPERMFAPGTKLPDPTLHGRLRSSVSRITHDLND
jgi:hypothetical protein